MAHGPPGGSSLVFHDPKGIPNDIQNISIMVEIALVADSMQDLIERTRLKSPELGATAIEAEPSCTYDKIRIPRETAENGQILDPCICRLTSMAIHRTLEHMGGGKGFPPWLNMGGSMTPFDICDQCLHQEHHVEESTQQRCKTKIGLVWCGTVMYFGVTAHGVGIVTLLCSKIWEAVNSRRS